MPLGMLFWVLMILWLIFGFAWNSNPSWTWGWIPNQVLLFVLFGILGWHAFGAVIHG